MNQKKAKALRKALNYHPRMDRKYYAFIVPNPLGLNKQIIVNHPHSPRAMYIQAKKQTA